MKKRDLEKKLLLKSETLRDLDLTAASGGKAKGIEVSCFPKTECLFECTFTYIRENG